MYQAHSKSTYCRNSRLIIRRYKTLHKSLQKYYYFNVNQNFKAYQFKDFVDVILKMYCIKNKEVRIWYRIFRFTIYSFRIILRTGEEALSIMNVLKVLWRISISFELLCFSIFRIIKIMYFLNFTDTIIIKDISSHW